MESVSALVDLTSAGRPKDKGALCAFAFNFRTEATEEGSLMARRPVATAA